MSRYFTPSPFWRRLTRWHWHGMRLARQVAREYATDPAHRAKVNDLLRRAEAGETGPPLDLNQLTLQWGLRDRNPMPLVRLWRWLP